MKKQGKKQDRDIGRITAASSKCKDCSTDFVIESGEINWYNRKGFPLPKRCPDCRKKRREAAPKNEEASK